MADGSTNLDEAVRIENFGRNVIICARLLGLDIDSVAVKADINSRIIIGYKLGQGALGEDRELAIANVLGFSGEDRQSLFFDADTDEEREERMRKALQSAGSLQMGESEPEPKEGPALVEHEVETAPEIDVEISDDSKLSAAGDVGDRASQPDLPTEQLLGRNIRAAVKKAGLKMLQTLTDAGVEVDQMFMAHFEKGRRQISDDQLDKIAKLTGVTTEVLYSGEGLQKFFPKPKKAGSKNSLVPIRRVLDLPPISPERMTDFFRGRVFHSNVEPGEGVTVGQLMELARSPDDVNFEEAWLNLTKEGQAFEKGILQHAQKLQNLGEVARVFYATRLIEIIFPKEAE